MLIDKINLIYFKKYKMLIIIEKNITGNLKLRDRIFKVINIENALNSLTH